MTFKKMKNSFRRAELCFYMGDVEVVQVQGICEDITMQNRWKRLRAINCS